MMNEQKVKAVENESAEELRICLTNNGLGGVIENIAVGLLKKKLKKSLERCDLDINLNKISVEEKAGMILLHADLQAKMSKADLIKFVLSKMAK